MNNVNEMIVKQALKLREWLKDGLAVFDIYNSHLDHSEKVAEFSNTLLQTYISLSDRVDKMRDIILQYQKENYVLKTMLSELVTYRSESDNHQVDILTTNAKQLSFVISKLKNTNTNTKDLIDDNQYLITQVSKLQDSNIKLTNQLEDYDQLFVEMKRDRDQTFMLLDQALKEIQTLQNRCPQLDKIISGYKALITTTSTEELLLQIIQYVLSLITSVDVRQLNELAAYLRKVKQILSI